MQRNCIFPGRYAPLTYYDWLRGPPRNTLMAHNAREICNFFVVSDLETSVPSVCKTPKWIVTYSYGVVCCVKNRNPIELIFRKIIDLHFML